MKIFYFFLLNFVSVVSVAQKNVSIIPQPVSLELLSGSFIVDAKTSVQYNPSQKELKQTANFFISLLKIYLVSIYLLTLSALKKFN